MYKRWKRFSFLFQLELLLQECFPFILLLRLPFPLQLNFFFIFIFSFYFFFFSSYLYTRSGSLLSPSTVVNIKFREETKIIELLCSANACNCNVDVLLKLYIKNKRKKKQRIGKKKKKIRTFLSNCIRDIIDQFLRDFYRKIVKSSRNIWLWQWEVFFEYVYVLVCVCVCVSFPYCLRAIVSRTCRAL